MKATKPGATLPKATRTTLRRTDFFRIGHLIQTASDISAGSVCYKPGKSDDSIAKEATDLLGFEVTVATIVKARQSLFGTIPGEAGSARQKIEALRQQIASLSKAVAAAHEKLAQQIKDHDDRLHDLEQLATSSQPQHRQPTAVLPARSLDYPSRANGSGR